MNVRALARTGLVLAAVVAACTDSEGTAPSSPGELDGGSADTGSPDVAQVGDSAAGDADANAPEDLGPDDFTLGSVTLTEQASDASADGLDPMIRLLHQRTDFPPHALLHVGSSRIDSHEFVDETIFFIYGAGGPTLSGTYAFGGEAFGHVSMTTSRRGDGGFEYQCQAAGGSLSITDSGPGTRATGTFTVTAWSGGEACPAAPTAGSFHIVHDPDDLTGNPGTQGDSFTVNSVTYTEGGDVLYAPFVHARHYGKDKTLIVTMRAGVSVVPDAGSMDERHIELYVYGSGSTAGGTYPIGTGALVTYQSGDLTCLAPVDGNGSVTLSAYGAVGSKIAGSITIEEWNSGTGCPATPWTVPFSATREADE